MESASSLREKSISTMIVIKSRAAVSVAAILIKPTTVSGVVVMIRDDLLSECKCAERRCKRDDSDEGKAIHNSCNL